MCRRSVSTPSFAIALTLAAIVMPALGAPTDLAEASEPAIEPPVYDIWHVAATGDDATGTGSIGLPFATIQHAVDMADPGDVVAVHPGTYTGAGNRDIDPAGKEVVIRSWEDDPLTCIIDCQGSSGDPHRGFWFHTGETTATVVRGFTITGAGGHTYGGAILVGDPGDDDTVPDVTPRVEHCILRENSAGNGAGMACVAGWDVHELNIADSQIVNNDGSGLAMLYPIDFEISDCVVDGNDGTGIDIIFADYVGEYGAHITRTTVSNNAGAGFVRNAADAAGQVILTDCEIVDNGSWGIYYTGEGGAELDLINCLVRGNGAGGVYIRAYGAEILASDISHNGGVGISFETRNYPNAIVQTTVCSNEGDGIYLDTYEGVEISSVTCAYNEGDGLVINYLYDFGWSLENCIAAFNLGVGMTWVGAPPFAVVCNDIYGNTGGDWDAIPGYLGTDGNIGADPAFCAPGYDDYRIAYQSPCAPGYHPDGADCGLIGAMGVSCDILGAASDVPAVTALLGNHPNPFNPSTTIAYEIATDGPVALQIFDLAGRLVATLVDENQPAGRHRAVWRGDDRAGRAAASGAYFCRLVADDQAQTRRMMLVR